MLFMFYSLNSDSNLLQNIVSEVPFYCDIAGFLYFSEIYPDSSKFYMGAY